MDLVNGILLTGALVLGGVAVIALRQGRKIQKTPDLPVIKA